MRLPEGEAYRDRMRRRLLARIQRKIPTVTEEIRVGGASIRFTRVADPNRVLDDVVAEEDRREKAGKIAEHSTAPHLPYWAELWESARGIAAALGKMKLTHSTRVLDLGCGMGLGGVAAAALGARVTLADLESPALLFARLNGLIFGGRVRVRRLNWRSDRLGERFDLILGADILYETQQWEFLNEFWKAHLAPGGSVLLGEPGRQSGDTFGPWIRQRGWMLREGTEQANGKSIRVFRLMRE
ncbi:MAG: methyltransferase domain-containing protein [Tepidisphaeraceae bacterium]